MTNGLSAIAVSGAPVGVVLERQGRDLDLLGIAESNFCGGELEMLNAEPERVEANFYRIWTRKEACLKLLGTGLSRPMGDIDTSREKLMVACQDGRGKRIVRLRTYAISEDCPVSLATGHEATNIRFLQVEPNLLTELAWY